MKPQGSLLKASTLGKIQMINIDKIMEHIDRIGVEEAQRRLDQYAQEVDGPSAEEWFGKNAVDSIQKEINIK